MLIHLQSFIRTCMATHLHISLYTAKRKKSRHTLLSLRFLFMLFFLPFFFLFPLTRCFDLARSFAWQNIHIFMCHSQTCLHTVFASISFRLFLRLFAYTYDTQGMTRLRPTLIHAYLYITLKSCAGDP